MRRTLTAGLLGAALATTMAVPAGARTLAPDGDAPAQVGADRAAGASAGPAAGVRRSTTLGPVRGLASSRTGTYSWLGIPYAEPPTGNRRWRPPVTHEPWSGVRRTTTYGEGCPQPGRFFSPSPDGPHYGLDIRDGLGRAVGREDCLTLNVHRPDSRQRDLPVLVFVHGGSNTVGYSADPMYDGRRLARRANAVVVTVNYRLGFFGWFDQAALKNGDPENDSGNFGTLDQIEALRFVNDNARSFGGDPRNVTVMGESAGAVNVWALIVSPLTEGLFDKAIPMSGGFSFTNRSASQTYGETFTAAVLSEAEPGEDVSDPVAYLRSKSARYLQNLALRHPELNSNPPAVIPDGAVLPEEWRRAVATGRFRHVPVLAGNMFEEGKLFGSLIGAYEPSDYRRFTLMHRFDPEHPTGRPGRYLKPGYLPATKPGGWNDASAAVGDAVFTPIVVDSMTALDEAGVDDLYYYEFGWNEEPEPFDTVYGAVHAMDLPFVFGTFARRHIFSFAFSQENRPGRTELSRLMGRSVKRFLRTGSPQHPGVGRRWEQWPQAMVLDAGRRHAFTELRERADTQAQHAQELNGR